MTKSRLGKKNTIPSAGERRKLVAQLRSAAALGDHLATSALLTFANQADLNGMLRLQIARLDEIKETLGALTEQHEDHTQ